MRETDTCKHRFISTAGYCTTCGALRCKPLSSPVIDLKPLLKRMAAEVFPDGKTFERVEK